VEAQGKAERDQRKLAQQVERLEGEVKAEKEPLRSWKATKKKLGDEQVFLRTLVKQAEDNAWSFPGNRQDHHRRCCRAAADAAAALRQEKLLTPPTPFLMKNGCISLRSAACWPSSWCSIFRRRKSARSSTGNTRSPPKCRRKPRPRKRPGLKPSPVPTPKTCRSTRCGRGKKEAEKLAKWESVGKEIQDATNKYNADGDRSAKKAAALELELTTLRAAKEKLNREAFELARQVELGKSVAGQRKSKSSATPRWFPTPRRGAR